MIEIDGSYGEGGGSLLRISTAFSALTGKPISIKNIRSGRPKPGLMPQHFHSVKAIGQLCQAKIMGLEIGSEEIKFIPGPLKNGKFKVDMKTAGSTSLVLQAFMIPAFFAPGPVEIIIKGGTDVKWAPPFDYIQNVTIPIIRSMGCKIQLELIQRGYYPRGGGIIKARITPTAKLRPLNLLKIEIKDIKGISYCNRLPQHVAQRQAQKAEEILNPFGYPVKIDVKFYNESLSPGSGIVLWAEGEDLNGESANRGTKSNKNGNKTYSISLGSSSLGSPGKRAEIVGEEAANELIKNISHKAPLDKYMTDQIIPYMAIAGHSSFKTGELTMHALTNIYAASQIMKTNFKVDGKCGGPAIIEVI